jgi:hypothetical protein
MNDKDRCDVLLKLAEFRMTRVTSRREHEWKVTVALWALLAAGVIYLRIPNMWGPPTRWAAMVPVVWTASGEG